MATLTYWKSSCLCDSNAHSVRAKTRKEVKRILTDEMELVQIRDGEWGSHVEGIALYGKIEKVTVQYKDAFDLAKELLSECGAWY